MAVHIQLRRDTAANWASANPVLLNGEPAVETDTGNLKIGDGTTAWNALTYTARKTNDAGHPITKTNDYAAAASDLVLADGATAGFTVTLPSSPVLGDTVGVLKVDNTAAEIRVYDPARTINGDPDATLVSQWAGGTFRYAGTLGWVLTGVTATTTAVGGGAGGSSGAGDVTIDFDGTLIIDGQTFEMATDLDVANAVAAAVNTRAATDLSNVDPATARTRLALGGAALLPVGTGASTVAAGDDSRIVASLKQWAPSTAYALGATVMAPHGQLVRALAAHTSGAQYDRSLWLHLGPVRRDPRYWPFDEWSIANLPIAVTATWDVTSTGPGTRTASFLRNVINFPWVAWDNYSIPVYYATTSDPFAHMTDTGYGPRFGDYYIPAGAVPSAGSDASMAIIDPGGRFADESWTNVKNSDTHWTCGRHEHIDLYGDGIGPANGIHASGSSLLAGHIRLVDYLAGEIPHALCIALDGSTLYHAGTGTTDQDYGYTTGGGLGYVWPATEQDVGSSGIYSTDPNAVPMGQAVGIPPWVNVETLTRGDGSPITEAGRMIARAFQRYGGWVCDRTGGTGGVSAEPTIPSAWITQARLDMLAIWPQLTCLTNSTQATPNGGELLPDGSNRVWPMAPPLRAPAPML